MNRDHLAVFAAYLLLVGVVAWTTFDIRRTLDTVRDDVCATAEIVVANELTNLIIAAEEGTLSESVETIIEEYIDLADRLQERCGERVSPILGDEL